MDREDIHRLLREAMRLTGRRDFVIIGSLSVLGAVASPPTAMAGSIDVDLYPRHDPAGASEIAAALGLDSEFEQAHGFYADAVSPLLATLPEGWEERMVRVGFPSGVTAWFLEPNDAAVSKYSRGEPRDREWIRAGLAAGVLSPATIAYRLRETVMEPEERQRAEQALAEDREWLGRAADPGDDGSCSP
jgi:hypothetical protein